LNTYEIQNRLAADDQYALKELYDRWGDNLFQLAIAIIRSKEMAEEIVEDVFIKLWEKRRELSAVANLKFYLMVMTKNRSYDYLRRYGNKDISLDDWAIPYYRVESTPEDLLITDEIINQVNKAINDLPAQCRLIFKLVKEDGLKYREAAELLQLSQKTIENQIGIALKKIHAAINIHLPRAFKD